MKKLDFDIDTIRKNKLELLDCQIDIILRSLELYAYTYNYVCPKKKSETLEENLRKCLIRDTYHQLVSEFGESKKKHKIVANTNNVLDIEKRFRKIA